ncbi:MAG: hypothetical protein AAF366_17240, partial [Pseudomonadota bacterium]
PHYIKRGDPFEITVGVVDEAGNSFVADLVEGLATLDSAGSKTVPASVAPSADTDRPVLRFAAGTLDSADRWQIMMRATKDGFTQTAQVALVEVEDSPFPSPGTPPDGPTVSADPDNAIAPGSDGGAFLDTADLGSGGGGGQGPAGPEGPEGPQGPAGPEGPQGPIGPQGPAGADGQDGAQGPEGPAGADGQDGAQGPAGPVGADGQGGDLPVESGGVEVLATPDALNFTGTGVSVIDDGGKATITITAGSGAQGPAGPAGPEGPEGPQGPAGPAGADGLDGAQGPEGPEGAVGPAGPAGPAGPEGAQGVAGPAGPAGDPGADGQDGAQGPAGPQGPEGPAGPEGPTDPDTLKSDETATLTAGYTVTPHDTGTVNAGTLTPDAANPGLQFYTNDGAHNLAPPADSCSIQIKVTNGANAGAITPTRFTNSDASALTTTPGDKFMLYITVIGADSVLDVRALQ